MAYPRIDEMLWFAGHWWWFPTASIDVDSVFEWRNNQVYLLQADGTAIEGILFVGEVSPD